ncbi:MAG: hypothetical protein L3J74_13180 [Bacteroidales bacterium]|nr:hypothetical protein [Bacteroidales bacterium]
MNTIKPTYPAILSILLSLFLFSCSSTKKLPNNHSISKTELKLILKAEKHADKAGKKVLEEGRVLALNKKAIIPGSCWNWINTVYNNAGYPNKNGKRKTVFKGKKKGPYAKSKTIKAGDWLYFINHSYNNIEHSGIFVYWVNYKKREAMILSYGGENRKQPGRYKVYDIRHVYNIIRPVSK